ncbi:MAG: hypothetical protein KAR36_03730, partial [Candidatus Latescibacteria bacterium]|nr:hypothetical protein [Candidatus Latescibacterota bacterium]
MKPTQNPISERIARLRAIALKGENRFRGVRGVLSAESYTHSVGQPLIVRKAQALAAVMRRWPMEIAPDEVLVGHHSSPDFG